MDGANGSTEGFLHSFNCHVAPLAYVNKCDVFVTANIHVKRMYMTGVNTGKCRAGETA
jgi:hypothetical protein